MSQQPACHEVYGQSQYPIGFGEESHTILFFAGVEEPLFLLPGEGGITRLFYFVEYAVYLGCVFLAAAQVFVVARVAGISLPGGFDFGATLPGTLLEEKNNLIGKTVESFGQVASFFVGGGEEVAEEGTAQDVQCVHRRCVRSCSAGRVRQWPGRCI